MSCLVIQLYSSEPEISQCMDYCNTLLAGITLAPPVSSECSAARLVYGARCQDYITPDLVNLHRLSVCKRVIFKMAAYTGMKVPTRRSPELLGGPLCSSSALTEGRQQLCSASSGYLMAPRTRNSLCQQAFFLSFFLRDKVKRQQVEGS